MKTDVVVIVGERHEAQRIHAAAQAARQHRPARLVERETELRLEQLLEQTTIGPRRKAAHERAPAVKPSARRAASATVSAVPRESSVSSSRAREELLRTRPATAALRIAQSASRASSASATASTRS